MALLLYAVCNPMPLERTFLTVTVAKSRAVLRRESTVANRRQGMPFQFVQLRHRWRCSQGIVKPAGDWTVTLIHQRDDRLTATAPGNQDAQ